MEEAIKLEISKRAKEFEDIDNGLFGDVVGTAQAIRELKATLDKIDKCLDERKYQEASNIGYSDVASSFVFLQRCLAGLQSGAQDIDKLVGEIAVSSGSNSYEETASYVMKALQCMQPKPEDSPEATQALRKHVFNALATNERYSDEDIDETLASNNV